MTDPCVCMNLRGHKKTVTDISFNPKVNEFSSSSEDHSLMIWHTEKNLRSYSFVGHKDVVTSIDYAPNGKLLASASKDLTVRLWIPTIKGGSAEFKAHTSAIRSVSFSPDGNQILTASNDKSVKLWDSSKRQFISSFLGHNNWVKCAKFSCDGTLIVSCSDDKTIRVWDSKSGETIYVFPCVKSAPNYIAIHENCNSIAAAMNTGSVRIYDIRAKKLQQRYSLHEETTCVEWHPKANYLLSSGTEGKLNVIDVMEGRPLYTLTGHQGAIKTIKFNPDGSQFASGGNDSHILVWKTNFIDSIE